MKNSLSILTLLALLTANVLAQIQTNAQSSTLSLTPCFSWVLGSRDDQNRFNGFLHRVETVETVPAFTLSHITQLKQGVNDRIGAPLVETCSEPGFRSAAAFDPTIRQQAANSRMKASAL